MTPVSEVDSPPASPGFSFYFSIILLYLNSLPLSKGSHLVQEDYGSHFPMWEVIAGGVE